MTHIIIQTQDGETRAATPEEVLILKEKGIDVIILRENLGN